jgi:hypothetical protein
MVRRAVVLLFVLLVMLVAGAGPATAGGPTSVLLSFPDKDRVAALYYSDTTYQRLNNLLEATGRDTTVLPVDATSPHRSGPLIRATWLIHDVIVWRTDEIFLEAPGGPWIATTLRDPGGGPAKTVQWHTSSRPGDLIAVLRGLGLLGGPKAQRPVPVDVPATTPAPAQNSAPAPAVVADDGALTGWRWSIPGFLAGGLLAAVAVQLLARRRDREPRWQLIDAE